MIGRTLGHYQITGKLGAGGMGVVYRARDSMLGRDVALKVLPADAELDPAARVRLLEEARTASALNHPHVCTIFEVGEAGGVTYAAMELVEGQPLGAQIPAEGLPTELTLRYGAQVADALAHAHERGVVHRDLKPANVIITPDGRAKVLDFGLARRMAGDELNQATRSQVAAEAGRVAGTLHYLAPEVLRGTPGDARADIWALGVVLYKMVSGRLPFDGQNGFEVSSAILRDALPPLPGRVPAGLRAVIQRCLAREPGQRYQHAGEVRAALEAIHSSDPAVPAATVVHPVETASPRRPWWRRKWVYVTAALAALLIVAFWKGPLLISIGKTQIEPPGARTSTGALTSPNTEANENFERGMFFVTAQMDLPRAQQMFTRAVELDPRFAEARGWLGFTHLLQIDVGYSNDGAWLYKAEEETRRAIELNPQLVRAHVTLAAIHVYRGRRDLAKLELDQAAAIDPEFFDTKMWLASYHWLNGDYRSMKDVLRPVLERNPMLFPVRGNLAEVRREEGDTAGAIREYQKILEQDPQSPWLVNLARANLEAGDLKAARKALESATPPLRKIFPYRLIRAILLAREGQQADARQEMDEEVLKYAGLSPFYTFAAAEFYAVLGETNKAVEWLDRAMRNGDARLEWFQRDSLLASIQKDPRFKQILESITYQRQQRAAGQAKKAS